MILLYFVRFLCVKFYYTASDFQIAVCSKYLETLYNVMSNHMMILILSNEKKHGKNRAFCITYYFYVFNCSASFFISSIDRPVHFAMSSIGKDPNFRRFFAISIEFSILVSLTISSISLHIKDTPFGFSL